MTYMPLPYQPYPSRLAASILWFVSVLLLLLTGAAPASPPALLHRLHPGPLQRLRRPSPPGALHRRRPCPLRRLRRPSRHRLGPGPRLCRPGLLLRRPPDEGARVKGRAGPPPARVASWPDPVALADDQWCSPMTRAYRCIHLRFPKGKHQILLISVLAHGSSRLVVDGKWIWDQIWTDFSMHWVCQ